MMNLNARALLKRSLSIVVWMVVSVQPATADWLIGRDGSKLETRGPWKVQGSLIVLTLPDGRLASIAVGDVDLERSLVESASTVAQANPTVVRSRPDEYPAPSPESSWVWTNRNLPAAESLRSVGDRSGPASSELSEAQVRVEFWAALKDERINSVAIQGMLRNSSAKPLRISRAWVEIVDPVAGNRSRPIIPRDPVLGAGAATSFRARFAGLNGEHSDPEFTILVEPYHASTSKVD